MKKIIALLLALVMVFSALAMTACDGTETPTEAPTEAPTEKPTEAPTEEPTEAPTEEPTEAPTEEPTEEPTEAPTEEPTEAPTEEPTEAPTEEPTEAPTEAPTEEPALEPNTTHNPVDVLKINGIDIGEYVIVSNTAKGGVMTTAATELQKYIELTCGKKLDIVEGTVPAGTKRILIDGEVRIPDDNDSWGVYSDEDGLTLAGTAKRSALYAVYYFLEEYLDWRFFTSDCETVYDHHEINLENIDDSYTHQYKVRGLYTYDYEDSWISVKRYFNESSKRNLSAEQGGMEGFTYMGIHNFAELSGFGSEGTQPCLNDQQVLDNILNSTINYLNSNPGVPSVHISQEDNNNYCKCDKCMADIDYYGAPSGSIIEMLNYVCEGLENYNGGIYKDVKVITFIYRYSFDAPDNIICHDNIVVEYTIIDLCHQHAITDPECNHVFEDKVLRHNAGILEEMNKWAAISKQCLIYDYGADFKFYYSAFPQFDVLRENYRYFSTIGAWGYMNLCNPHQPGCDFSELRFYLYAKLLQYPNMTEEEYQTHINEFLEAYYGPGWESIRAYFDWTIKAADDNGKCYGVYSTPETIFGRNVFGPMDEQFQAWFDAALEAAETEEQKIRIRRIRISADYLAISDNFSADYKSDDPAVKQAIVDRTAQFLADLRELGLEWVTESRKLQPEYSERTKPRSF